MATERKHILLVSFPGFGHMIPLVELGKKLAPHHDVTFAVSACVINEIQKRGVVSTEDFHLVGIPDGLEMDMSKLPDRELGLNVAKLVPIGVRELLKAIPTRNISSSGANVNVKGSGENVKFAITSPVDVVIGDNLNAGELTVCHERGIPYYMFNTASANQTLGALVVDEDYPIFPEGEDNLVAFQEIPERGAPCPPISAVVKRVMLRITETIPLAQGIIVNSVLELDQDKLDMINTYPAMRDIPMFFVGPLIPVDERVSETKLEQQGKVQDWLDAKADRSVVYLSFGSVGFLLASQITELSKALLALGKPFIWSMLPHQMGYLPEEIKSNLNHQLDNHDDRFLILPWVPQKLVLNHPATSVFLTHCGWNSTVESLAAGVPVVAWPMFSDQKLNAQQLVKRGVAVLVENTALRPKRIVPAAEIETALRTVGWSGGDATDTSYRQAALQDKAMLSRAVQPGGSSAVAFQELIKLNFK